MGRGSVRGWGRCGGCGLGKLRIVGAAARSIRAVRTTSAAFACLLALGGPGCDPPAPRPSPTSAAVTTSASPVSASVSAPPAPPAVSVARASDGAIDALVARLSSSHGLWSNGHFPKLDSPAGQSTTDLLTELFARDSSGKDKVSTFEIVEEREVRIGDARPYRAVRLVTNRGKMIVLLRFDRSSWWTRSFVDGDR